MRVRFILLAALLFASGCGGGSGAGPLDRSDPREILVIAIARSDRSLPAEDTLEGYLAFFDRVDPDGSVFSRELRTPITPGLVPGVGYAEGINVDPGRKFQLAATVTTVDGGTLQVVTDMVTVPSALEIEIPEEVGAGEPLAVTWSVTGAERVNGAAGVLGSRVHAGS